jgi:hypothetical protein
MQSTAGAGRSDENDPNRTLGSRPISDSPRLVYFAGIRKVASSVPTIVVPAKSLASTAFR